MAVHGCLLGPVDQVFRVHLKSKWRDFVKKFCTTADVHINWFKILLKKLIFIVNTQR